MRRMKAWLCGIAAIGFAVTMVHADDTTGGLPPWHFQMTKEDVSSFTNYGPYDSFRNGDLETYAGLFNGHKENIQFFFRDEKLVRIGIYLYEGQDIDAATNAWSNAYATLKSMFGEMQVRGIQADAVTGSVSPAALAAASGAAVGSGSKVQMAPQVQPADKFVFASFSSLDVQGHTFYYVRVFYDPPHNP
jgi:Ca2+-binding RTX toxin-like protein